MDPERIETGTARQLAARLGRQARHGFEPGKLIEADDLLALASDLGVEGDDASAAATAFHRLLWEATESLPEPSRNATRLLLGFDDRTRGQRLTQRRLKAADVLAISPESFRKSRERRLLMELAGALLIVGANRRLGLAAGASAADRLVDAKRVLVIHGNDITATESMFRFLEALGLRPITWRAALAETGVSTPHIVDGLQAAMDVAQAVVVVLTPGELGAPTNSDSAETKSPTAGQLNANVIFEAGLALGIAPTRTILVEVGGETVLPSDLAEISVLRLTNTAASRNALRRQLQAAGCIVEAIDPAWLEPECGGDFSAVLFLRDAVKTEVTAWIADALRHQGSTRRHTVPDEVEISLIAAEGDTWSTFEIDMPTLRAKRGLPPRARSLIAALLEEAYLTAIGEDMTASLSDLNITYEPFSDHEILTIVSPRPGPAGTSVKHFSRIAGRVDLAHLASMRVAVIGLDSLGSVIANELTNSGVQSLRLIDGDSLELANISRHVLTSAFVGRNKAEAMASFLRERLPQHLAVEYVAHYVDGRMSDSQLDKMVADADLVIATTDDRSAQRRIAACAVAKDVPAIFPALYEDGGGEIFVSLGPGAPCLLCWEEFRTTASEYRTVSALNAELLPLASLAVHLALGLLDPKSSVASMFAGSATDPSPRNLFLLRPFAGVRVATVGRRANCPMCQAAHA